MSSRARAVAEDPCSEMAHWLSLLWEFRAKAVLVLGPAPFAANDQRELVSSFPADFHREAAALARSEAYGPPWRLRLAPLVAWRNLLLAQGPEEPWLAAWQARGGRSLVRVDFPTALGHGFECFTFCGRPLAGEQEAMRIAYTVMKLWPTVKAQVVLGRHDITPRELEVLRALADGLTVKDAADCIGIAERTVAFHLGNLQIKLHAGNRASVVQRACCLGLL